MSHLAAWHWRRALFSPICVRRIKNAARGGFAAGFSDQTTRPRMDMSTFDQREDSFEKRYVHDEELRFKAEARRNKLVGLWAAEKLGKSGADAQAYADALVAAEVSADADERVVAMVKKDFEAAGIDQSEHQIRRTMDEMLAKAKAEIKAGQ
jgi:hypothetical protein